MRFLFLIKAALLSFSVSFTAGAAEPIALVLHPREIEEPRLKYRLFPAEAEIKPGNAVPILLRLPWEQTPWMTNVYPKLHEWEDRPLSAPEWNTFDGVLPSHFYDSLKRAAFRRDAFWEYPIQETQTPYMILLPDVQGLRGFLTHGLSAKIRYHLSRGELDEAREGILVGMANARHVAQTPFLVNQLVASAIEQKMLRRTGELISQPGSPNLYWALTTLPESLLEMDRTASLEADLFAMTFPAVHDLDRPRDDREWRRMGEQLVQLLRELTEIPSEPKEKKDSILGQLLDRLLPAENVYITRFAKEGRPELPRLLGIPEEKVAAMSDEEAAVRWYMAKRLARDQHMGAVLVLPPREAWPQLRKLHEEIDALQERIGGKKIEFLNPLSVYLSVHAVDRNVQALRVVEAVRHHLAREGMLPAKLEEIADVPIPLDPLTDQPFQWNVESQTATLKAPPLPGDLPEVGAANVEAALVEYRLTVK